jgi:hypothetical protein
MLQRAYYDLLKDVAHLSSNLKSIELKPIIRLTIFEFEAFYGKRFSHITGDESHRVLSASPPAAGPHLDDILDCNGACRLDVLKVMCLRTLKLVLELQRRSLLL